MAIKPYLQLVRLPNLFTAAADSLAGWLIVRGSLADPGDWVPLVLTSVCLYAFGIALNDLVDYEVDLVERPSRPLPSGRVSRSSAVSIVGVAFFLGLFLEGFMRGQAGNGPSHLVVGMLAVAIFAYNSVLKRTPIAPLVMGSCRGLNLLLGLSASPSFGGPVCWLMALALTVFVAGVTWISRSEVDTGRRGGIAFGVVVEALGLAGLSWAALQVAGQTGHDPYSGLGPVVLAGVAAVVGLADLRALRLADPRTTQRAVKTGVLALVWLDVALVASAQGPALALVVAALWVPAFVLGRWLYST